MNAFVNGSSNISYSLTYGQNKEKGGEIILSNFVDRNLTPEEQASEWNAMSNDYRTKVYNIVISMSDADTVKIRNIKDSNIRVGFEKSIIKAFLNELALKGNNVNDCPYVVAHHGNTDNEHFHITILTTTVDGRRFNDKFLKKNSSRAAAKVSMDYKLEACRKALEREKAHQKAVGGRKKEKVKRVHSRPRNQSEFQQRMRRHDAVVKAEQRKKSAKYMIEKIAKESNTHNFVENLLKEGLTLYHDPKLGFYVTMHDDSADKDYSYLLEKHLDVDITILPKVDYVAITRSMKPDDKEKKKAKVVQHKIQGQDRMVGMAHSHVSHQTAILPSTRHGNILGNNAPVSSSKSLDGDQNPDGTYNKDDLDEEWKRKNGYHL